MKTVRLNKPQPVVVKSTALDSALQAGNKVLLRRIPEDIKKAKKLFKVDKKYTIQEPPKNHLNTQMTVYLKGNDDNLYPVGFPYFMKVAK